MSDDKVTTTITPKTSASQVDRLDSDEKISQLEQLLIKACQQFLGDRDNGDFFAYGNVYHEEIANKVNDYFNGR